MTGESVLLGAAIGGVLLVVWVEIEGWRRWLRDRRRR